MSILEKTGTRNDVELTLYAQQHTKPDHYSRFVGLALRGMAARAAMSHSSCVIWWFWRIQAQALHSEFVFFKEVTP